MAKVAELAAESVREQEDSQTGFIAAAVACGFIAEVQLPVTIRFASSKGHIFS